MKKIIKKIVEFLHPLTGKSLEISYGIFLLAWIFQCLGLTILADYILIISLVVGGLYFTYLLFIVLDKMGQGIAKTGSSLQ